MNFEPTIKLEKAHDVRELRGCIYCGNIGDRRFMVKIGEGKGKNEKLSHGGCAVAALGMPILLRLPRTELAKISLGEIGPRNMRTICEHLERQS